jgi:hypothetical protein
LRVSEELYTNSRLRLFQRCPRAHRFRYELGFTTPSGPAAEFGAAAHASLEAWYRQWKYNGVCDERCLDAALEAAQLPDPVDAIRLRCIVAAYHAMWSAERWEIVDVEREFTYWLGDIQIGGKVDAIVRNLDDGHAYLVEHKTSTQDTSPGSPYWAKLSLDSQISIYHDGAEFGLETPVAGCIYDVLKRPTHEPLMATPADKRRMTLGKGCRTCGGSAGGKTGVQQGRGYLEVTFASEVKRPECADCKGTGWKCDAEGNPQAPHLDARQRDRDETLEEFEARLIAEIAARPGDFLSRGTIVRLDSELPIRRAELIEQIRAMQALGELAPPNHSACAMGREMCGYFTACSGQADINDFPRAAVHSELSAITNRAA